MEQMNRFDPILDMKDIDGFHHVSHRVGGQ